MTSPQFETQFPEFARLDIAQPYDTEDGAALALAAFRQSWLDAMGEGDLSRDEQRAAAETARALVGDMDTFLKTFVAAIMPPELATENADYEVGYGHGSRLWLDEQLTRLAQDPSDGEESHFRLANGTLEQNLQAVLDHLTAKRIAEEMDAPTYIERLRGAFRRVRDGARAQAAMLDHHVARAHILGHRLAVVAYVTRFLRETVIPKLETEETADKPPLADTVAQLERFAANAKALSDHFQAFLTLSQTSLIRLQRDFAAPANMAGAEGESILVSRDIERHAFYRPLPLLWALVVTLLVKIVLAHNTAEMLHDLAVPLLVLAFVLSWTLSIYVGIWARASRMKAVQAHIRNQLRHVLLLDSSDDEIIEFPRIRAGQGQPPQDRLAAYPYRGHAARHKRTVLQRNLYALAIPAVLAAAVLITREDADQDFIARFPGADPCVLASGRMVFATQDAYFVQPSGRSGTIFEGALARVFPELMADVVYRADIIGVHSHAPLPANDLNEGITNASLPHATPGQRLQDCVSAQTDKDSLTIIHQGNAFGAFNSEEAVNTFTEQTQNLIAALALPRPVTIDLGGAGGASAAAVTLDLGDTSLDVLNQAFLGGTDGQGGLTGELQLLRLALENSNEIAAKMGLGNEKIVQVLDQRLSSMIDVQETMGVAVAAAFATWNDGPVIVTPTVFGPAKAGNSAPAVGPVSAHIFQTAIELPGAGPTLNTLGNTLVLPFFTAPVRNGDPALATPQGAFDWGADTRHLTDPAVTEDGTSYFKRIAQTLESCLVGNASVEVDLIGLASPSWDGPTGRSTPATLNYYLAEGRRIGALRRLGTFMADGNERRVRVQLADGTSAPMHELVALATGAPGVDAVLPRFGRFDSQGGFEQRRDTLLAVTGLNPQVESPLEELFARSVVLRVVKTDGGPCAF